MSKDPTEMANRMWSSAAADYDDISFSISDALVHTTMRLNPSPGDSVIDIATGTGMSARFAARFAASVTGIDIADGLLAAAREIAAHCEPPITFTKADAASLPFPDAHFDRAISTFGIMFAPDQEGAAAELARILKPGGRAVITSWVPDPAVGRIFELVSEYQDSSSAGGPSPMVWGEERGVSDLLGENFELSFENGVSYGYFDSTEHLWRFYIRTFGPMREIVEANDDSVVQELGRRFKEEHEKFDGGMGLTIPRPYLLAKAVRRRSD